MAPAGERCVEPGAPLSEVLPRLATDELRRLLVCRDRELEGLLSFTDVARLMEVRTRAAWPAPEARGTTSARAPARPARVSWR
jgi:signal-transduction protein with cAMP-binding, CBS, and nucleotidyltransferase domain